MVNRHVMHVVRGGLALAAIWALRRQLAGQRSEALLRQLRAFGWQHLALGGAAVAASFLVLGAVELLGVRQAASRKAVSPFSAVGTSFVANALSQSIGLSVLTGAAVRARVYGRIGLSAPEITQVTAFVTISATLGLMACGAAAIVGARGHLLLPTGITVGMIPIAALLATVVAAYFAWAAFGRSDAVGIGRWTLARPSGSIALSQTALSAIDWVLTGLVLFAFIPAQAGLSFGVVLSAYLIAQVLAVTSHVPAGAGVLEVVTVGLLAGGAPHEVRTAVVAALLMFRVCYYLLPLVAAIGISAVFEWQSRASLRGAAVLHAG